MAETVQQIRQWLDTLPYDVEIGIDGGGLTLEVVDDPTMPHAPGCAKHATDAAECTCWKTARYEVGGLPA